MIFFTYLFFVLGTHLWSLSVHRPNRSYLDFLNKKMNFSNHCGCIKFSANKKWLSTGQQQYQLLQQPQAILSFTIIGVVYNRFFVYSHLLKYGLVDSTGGQIGITPVVMA